MEQYSKEALAFLNQDAKHIKALIKNQGNACISHCKAFEEVVDTQMYGFSKEVSFAVRIGAINAKQGHELMNDLEKELNELYTKIYENTTDQKEE